MSLFVALASTVSATRVQGLSGCVPHSDMVALRSRSRERLQQVRQPATPSSPSSTSSPVNLPPSPSPLTIVTAIDGRRGRMGWSSAGTSWANSRERSADATASTAILAILANTTSTACQTAAADSTRSKLHRARCRARAGDELGDELVTGRRRCRASQIASHVASSQRWLGENEPGASTTASRSQNNPFDLTAWKSQINLSITASQSQTNLFDLKTPPRDTGIGAWGGGAAGSSRRSSRRLLGVAALGAARGLARHSRAPVVM